MPNPTAAVLVIGNEILSGRTTEANLSFIAKRLADIGIDLKEARVIRDDEAVIIENVTHLSKAYTYLFTTGGIGPTHDDITVASIAKAINQPIERNQEISEKLKQALGSRATPATFKMADFPQNARLVPNPESIAPGFIVNNIIVLAGIPRIMQAMFDSIKHTLNGGKPVVSVHVSTNLPEGTIAEGLTEIQSRYSDVDIGSYPLYRSGGFFTTLVMRGTEPARNEAAAAEVRALIKRLGGEEIDEPGHGQ